MIKIKADVKQDSLYKILRKDVDGIQIVEINESGCDYHDFVLFYYHVDEESLKIVRDLIQQYKNEKTVCLIGASSYIPGCGEEPDDLLNEPDLFDCQTSEMKPKFDMFFDFLEPEDFENLIVAALYCRNGVIHGDPQDYVNFGKDVSDLELYSAIGKTLEDAAGKIINKINENSYEPIKKMIVTVVCDESLLISDVEKVITILKTKAIPDCQILWSLCSPANDVDKKYGKIVLITA